LRKKPVYTAKRIKFDIMAEDGEGNLRRIDSVWAFSSAQALGWFGKRSGSSALSVVQRMLRAIPSPTQTKGLRI